MAENKLNLTRETSFSLFLVLFFLFFFFHSDIISAVRPSGANVSSISNQTAPIDSAGSHAAVAGNVTELNIVGFTTTQSWQGYYGNVTGSIQLADSSNKAFYNWSLASPEGEIYASTNNPVSWTTIHCFNYTANGTAVSDPANAGGYSPFGMNLSILESIYNISSDAVDGVNETFTLLGVGTHDGFYTNSLNFSEGECRSTRIFGDTGSGVNDEFEEVLLFDSTTQSVVFASLLDENILGFDNRTHDFEMMVLEDGHLTDAATTIYYFYVELQ